MHHLLSNEDYLWRNCMERLRCTWQQKTGSNEAVKLLLAHGASFEVKTKNGMTPLHLAVWYSLRAEDCSTVKTLLEHNADCSSVDNEGMTPLNHLTQGPGSEKLRELLHRYLEEERKCRAIEACSETKSKMDEFNHALSNIVGLHEIKVQLRKWAKGMLLDERRRTLGLKIGAPRPPNMAFLGNPGAGKTMVAQVLGRLLHMVGILPIDMVTEVQRTDLIGGFVGHKGPKTRGKIKEAEGGLLFVDEAYRLIPMQNSDDKDGGKVVVIFAGYSELMKRVIFSNEVFCRRVTKFFYFDDFSLSKILHLKMTNQAEDSFLCGFII